jgi:hypothetical protein
MVDIRHTVCSVKILFDDHQELLILIFHDANSDLYDGDGWQDQVKKKISGKECGVA